MRSAIFFLSTLLLWAGTISIHLGNRPPSTSLSTFSCANTGEGTLLLNHLHMGRITTIRDNGQILTVGLSSQWSTLPSEAQNSTYKAVACYARAQQRAFRIIEIP